MSTYLDYKQKVTDYFDDCIAMAEANGFDKHIETMLANRKRVADNKLIVLACGEARRGKSTLLTALLEDDRLFPVDVEVTTCLTTTVYWGDTEKIKVTFEDGTEKQISRAEIQEYVTEKRNENNAKKAKWIVVETPNPKLKNGLVFIDTPGVGSLNPMHTEVTYSVLPQADVVLFISDATAPLTEPELVFLKGVRKHCQNLLFILTKKDLNAEYEATIGENIDKIEEFASIPRNKICYIPVSGTMRLASLHNGSQRMAKSSNFEQLESVIWNTIDKNRAGIIIAPPLGELAGCLRDIDKEIHIQSTALSGNAEQQQELKIKLLNLQQDRQRLLSDSSAWQMDIQRNIDMIAADQNKLMVEFRNEATDVLERGLMDPRKLKQPQLLLNEIILMASSTAHDIGEQAYTRLSALKADFEETTKLSLYDSFVKNDLRVEDDPVILLQKQKPLDMVISGGRKVAMNSMGGGMAGGIIGGIIGGVVGLLGGPGGVVAGITYGATIGAGTGTVGGGVKGFFEAVKNPCADAAPQIRAAISKYINQTVSEWQLNHPQYIKGISHKFIKSLRESIEQSKKTIENDISELQASSKLDEKKRLDALKQIEKAKVELAKLIARLNDLRNAKVEEVGAEESCKMPPKSGVTSPADGRSMVDYSHLEN